MQFSETFIEYIILIALTVISISVIILIVLLIKDYRKKQIW